MATPETLSDVSDDSSTCEPGGAAAPGEFIQLGPSNEAIFSGQIHSSLKQVGRNNIINIFSEKKKFKLEISPKNKDIEAVVHINMIPDEDLDPTKTLVLGQETQQRQITAGEDLILTIDCDEQTKRHNRPRNGYIIGCSITRDIITSLFRGVNMIVNYIRRGSIIIGLQPKTDRAVFTLLNAMEGGFIEELVRGILENEPDWHIENDSDEPIQIKIDINIPQGMFPKDFPCKKFASKSELLQELTVSLMKKEKGERVKIEKEVPIPMEVQTLQSEMSMKELRNQLVEEPEEELSTGKDTSDTKRNVAKKISGEKISYKACNEDYLSNEIRMVLVGKRGVGKTMTCNTIFGHQNFKSLPSAKTVTKFCEYASLQRFGRNLQVVEMPGFRDISSSTGEVHKQLMQFIAMVSPGIHAILFVVRIGRYTEEDLNSVEDLIKIFGSKSKDFVIVVFTGEDDLDEENDLQTFIQDSDVSLKKFLQEVNNRFISVNNKGTDEEKSRFVERLLHKIEQLLRDNKCSYYACDMLDNAEEQIKKLEDMRAKEKEVKNKERDEKIIAAALEEYKAQLAKEKISQEEETKRIEEKKSYINMNIETDNHLQARIEVREALSETLEQYNDDMITGLVKEQKTNRKGEQKSDAGLYTAVGAGATAGATVGAIAGPVGAAIGGLAGATYGAFLNWWR